jgi:hypothetical protein
LHFVTVGVIVVVELFVETLLFSSVGVVEDISRIFVVSIILVVSPIEAVVILESIVVSSGHFSLIETEPDAQKQAKCDISLVERVTNGFSEHIAVFVPQISVR